MNRELEILETFIEDMVENLEVGGVFAIITFHSLEDRIVKNVFKKLATKCVCPPSFPVCRCNHKAKLEILTRKPIVPNEKEIRFNSRSSSAKLRIAKKIA